MIRQVSFFSVSFLLCFGLLSSCKTRSSTKSLEASRIEDRVKEVNPLAFNAYNIWREGEDSERTSYPDGWIKGSVGRPDQGVFSVELSEFYKRVKIDGVTRPQFIAVPTEGAVVVSDVLQYPERSRRILRLRFLESDSLPRTSTQAMKQCQDQNGRLPTARELFDFCTAGVEGPNYGPGFQESKYPKSGRCVGSLWTASLYYRGALFGGVFSSEPNSVWTFNGDRGLLSLLGVPDYGGADYAGVRCVAKTDAHGSEAM
jgi:hypothetical protein